MKKNKFDNDVIMNHKAMKRILEEENKTFDVNQIFDKNYKEGKKIKVAPKKKEKVKDAFNMSFTTKKKDNSSFYKYEKY